MKRTKVRELLREELLNMLANSKRNDKLREPPIKISEDRLLRIVQEEIAREVDKISDSRDLLREATWEEFTGAADQWPIKQGHGGKWVKTIQAAIGAKTDGKFGPNTAKLLAAKAKGATEVDKALFGVLKKQTPTAVAKKKTGEEAVAAHEKAKVDAATKKAEEEKVAAAKKTGGSYNWHPSRPPYNLSAEDVERIWDEHVTSKDRNSARKDPGKAFVKGIVPTKIFGVSTGGTKEGLVYAALYYGGGYKVVNKQSRYALEKSAKAAVKGDFSGEELRFANWLGAANRRKVMSSDGELKKTK